MRLPELALPATDGARVNLAALKGRTVVYIYPRTGVPGIDPPDGWDMIPGARGCTPQSCSFRDHFAELKSLGVEHLFGLSTQDPGPRQSQPTRACVRRSRSVGWRTNGRLTVFAGSDNVPAGGMP
jgi:peroxiredoxin